MSNKILDTIEGSFSLLGLFGVITISVLTVSALNPKEYVPEQSSQVQGIQSENEEAGVPVQVTSIVAENENVFSNLNSTDGKYNLEFDLKNLNKGTNKFDLITAENLNTFKKKLNIKLSTRDLTDKVKIYLEDNLDKVQLLADNNITDRSLTIEAKSKRSIKLTIETDENINYPFELRLNLE